jgi:hypothetical protein
MDSQENENPRTAEDGEAVSGFPEPPGKDPGDISGDQDPHHSLNNPVTDPDPTEWPDPYDKREDPRGPDAEPIPGATSTSEPHPSQDIEAGDRAEPPERDNLDD